MAKQKFLTRREHSEYCRRMEQHHEHIGQRLDAMTDDMERMEQDMHKFSHEFQENVNEMCKSVTELTANVAHSMQMQDEMREQMKEQQIKVDKLEKSDGQKAMKIVWTILAVILTAAGTAIATQLFPT